MNWLVSAASAFVVAFGFWLRDLSPSAVTEVASLLNRPAMLMLGAMICCDTVSGLTVSMIGVVPPFSGHLWASSALSAIGALAGETGLRSWKRSGSTISLHREWQIPAARATGDSDQERVERRMGELVQRLCQLSEDVLTAKLLSCLKDPAKVSALEKEASACSADSKTYKAEWFAREHSSRARAAARAARKRGGSMKILTGVGTAIAIAIILSMVFLLPDKTYLAFVFGVVLVGVLIVMAVFVPEPTGFQYAIFRIVLALAAAGVAVFIPGLLNVTLGREVTASGALAVFVVVYFFAPAQLQGRRP